MAVRCIRGGESRLGSAALFEHEANLIEEVKLRRKHICVIGGGDRRQIPRTGDARQGEGQAAVLSGG